MYFPFCISNWSHKVFLASFYNLIFDSIYQSNYFNETWLLFFAQKELGHNFNAKIHLILKWYYSIHLENIFFDCFLFGLVEMAESAIYILSQLINYIPWWFHFWWDQLIASVSKMFGIHLSYHLRQELPNSQLWKLFFSDLFISFNYML